MPYVGDIKDIPKGWALCDGTNDTPDLTGRFLEGVTANPKIFKDAGLPNIKGSLGDYNRLNVSSGSITSFNYSSGFMYMAQSGYGYGFTFSAANYNPIYSDSITTVQPASYTVYYIMKVKK